MIYWLYEQLIHADIPGWGVLQYLSVRSALAFLVSLLLSLCFGSKVIRLLHAAQIGEDIRDLGLKGQKEKAGTPTMGGLLIVATTLLAVLLLADLTNVYVQIMLVSLVWLAGLGFSDDYLKLKYRSKRGLNGWLKILFQGLLGLFVALMLYLSPSALVGVTCSQAMAPTQEVAALRSGQIVELPREKNLKTTIPFFKHNELDYRALIPFQGPTGDTLAWVLFTLVVVLIVLSVSNGANLTDGLDGLVTGVSAPIAATLGIFAYLSGNVIYASYLNVLYIPYMGELVVFMSAFLGALVGFLWFNGYPARVFMGDTGSLTIGGIIGIYAVLVRKELLLPILCGIFLVESLSVIIQTTYFKYTRIRFGQGRRVFRMAPIHHHYQLLGHPETHIVVRMWIVSILLSVLTVVTLKIR